MTHRFVDTITSECLVKRQRKLTGHRQSWSGHCFFYWTTYKANFPSKMGQSAFKNVNKYLSDRLIIYHSLLFPFAISRIFEERQCGPHWRQHKHVASRLFSHRLWRLWASNLPAAFERWSLTSENEGTCEGVDKDLKDRPVIEQQNKSPFHSLTKLLIA